MAVKIAIVSFCLLSAVLASPLPCKGHRYDKADCIQMTPKKRVEIQQVVTEIGNYISGLAVTHEDLDFRYIKLDIESHREDEGEKETKIEVSLNDCSDTEDSDEAGTTKEDDSQSDKEVEKETPGNDTPEDTADNNQPSDTTNNSDNDTSKDQNPSEENDSENKTEDQQATDSNEEERNDNGNENNDASDDNSSSDSDNDTPVTTDSQPTTNDTSVTTLTTDIQPTNEQKIIEKPEFMFLNLDSNSRELLGEYERRKGPQIPLVVLVQENSEATNYIIMQ